MINDDKAMKPTVFGFDKPSIIKQALPLHAKSYHEISFQWGFFI